MFVPLISLALLGADPFPLFPRFDELKPEEGITATPLSLTLLDPGSAPGVFPSMEQSLTFYEDFAVGGNELFRRTFSTVDNPWIRNGVGFGSTMLWNVATDAVFALPFGAPHSAWMHEEWHRAVMSSHGINTFDTFAVPTNQLQAALADRFYIGSSGAVIGVSDEQLAAFKAKSPGDYVRMSTAGIESQYVAVRQIERDQFFFAGDDGFGPIRVVRAWNTGTLLLNVLTNVGYLAECASNDSTTFTENDEKHDPKNVLARDFTGLDCDASVYDMFRPHEPYDARGPHPSGVGIARFRDLAELSAAEKNYAQDTVVRAYIGLLDPALLNIAGVKLDDVVAGKPLRITGRVAHMLTPIGSAVEVESLAQVAPFNLAAIARFTATPKGVLPSADLTLVRMPFVFRLPGDMNVDARKSLSFIDPTVVTVTLDAQGWVQPHDIIATSDDLRAGGLLRMDIGLQLIPNLELIASGMAKSEGFAPGVVDTGAGGGVGLSVKTWIY
jgi:hypothetical protein